MFIIELADSIRAPCSEYPSDALRISTNHDGLLFGGKADVNARKLQNEKKNMKGYLKITGRKTEIKEPKERGKKSEDNGEMEEK